MSSRSSINVRPLEAGDETAWRRLWKGYLTFYEHILADEVSNETWRRLLSDDETFVGLAALNDDQLVGFAHYILHPSTWTIGDYCYLEDLYVDPESRGHGAGRRLIEEIYRKADQSGWSRVYWTTQEFNYKARILYDELARRTEFVIYER